MEVRGTVAEKVVRTVLVHGGLAVLLPVAGKRNLAQLNSFDLVVVLLLSNVVQNAIIGPDDSLTGALLAAVVLLGVNSLVVRVVNRSDLAVRVFEGEDIPLVKDGQFVDRSLRKEGLRRGDAQSGRQHRRLAQARADERDPREPGCDRNSPGRHRACTRPLVSLTAQIRRRTGRTFAGRRQRSVAAL